MSLVRNAWNRFREIQKNLTRRNQIADHTDVIVVGYMTSAPKIKCADNLPKQQSPPPNHETTRKDIICQPRKVRARVQSAET
jgi:hypothetical protein